jgi:hypothetical protein
MRVVSAGLIVAVGLLTTLAISPAAFAQSCRPGDIELGRDARGIHCRSRADYAACISSAGKELKSAGADCGSAIKECVDHQKAMITVGEATCMGTCLTSGGKRACIGICGAGAAASDYLVSNACLSDSNPCVSAALSVNRARVARCKRW